MNVLKSFIPENFATLTKEEKENAISNLVDNLCTKLGIKSLPVVYENLTNDVGNTIGGKFIFDPLQIIINKNFITDEKLEYLTLTKMDYDVAVSYLLVSTIAHECYHYFQFALEQKLINGENLSSELKELAYLYFVCLHDVLFSNFNKKAGIYTPCDLEDRYIYSYSPVELSADAFAYQIVELLGKYDTFENYNQYLNFHSLTYFNSIQRNIENGGNLTIKSIAHSLQSALDFLNYKNKTSGLKANYLELDTEDLQKNVIKASKKWIEKENKEIEVYTKIIKKR